MATNDTSTQQPDIINQLLTGGMPQQTQQQGSNVLQGLLSLVQPQQQNPQASLGPGTTNVLNQAAQTTGNPAMAPGNYDVNQNTGINQQQLAQTLQMLAQGNKSGQKSVTNQPVSASQQMVLDSAKKNYNKYLDTAAAQTPPQVLKNLIDSQGNSNTQGQSTAQPQPQVVPQPAQPSPQAKTSNNGVNKKGNSGMTDDIQDQAQRIAMQKPGLLMSILRGTFENNKEQQLENLKTVQVITQGGPPLSPAQRAEATGNWNSALLKQHQDFQSDLSDQMKANVDAQTAFIKNTPLPSKAADWPAYTAQLQQYSTNAYQISSKMQEVYNKYKGMVLTNPVTGKKSSSNQYSGITPDMARQELTNRIKNKKGNQ